MKDKELIEDKQDGVIPVRGVSGVLDCRRATGKEVVQVGEVPADQENPTHVMSFIGRTHGTCDGKKYTTILNMLPEVIPLTIVNLILDI